MMILPLIFCLKALMTTSQLMTNIVMTKSRTKKAALPKKKISTQLIMKLPIMPPSLTRII
ncbi:MAG TPA: hypothetical protein PKZ58_00710 [Bacillota bacterium]|nr:hypothetical protein [Bacillota bacterium]